MFWGETDQKYLICKYICFSLLASKEVFLSFCYLEADCILILQDLVYTSYKDVEIYFQALKYNV